MRVNVKPPDRVASKWAQRVAGATMDYAEGAQGAGQRWATAAAAGSASYKAGVAEAAAAGRYEKGVATAGAAKYERGITDKGAQRYGPGASAAREDFARAIGPVLSAIGAVDLPPRGPRRAPGNYQRSVLMAQALAGLATRK